MSGYWSIKRHVSPIRTLWYPDIFYVWISKHMAYMNSYPDSEYPNTWFDNRTLEIQIFDIQISSFTWKPDTRNPDFWNPDIVFFSKTGHLESRFLTSGYRVLLENRTLGIQIFDIRISSFTWKPESGYRCTTALLSFVYYWTPLMGFCTADFNFNTVIKCFKVNTKLNNNWSNFGWQTLVNTAPEF